MFLISRVMLLVVGYLAVGAFPSEANNIPPAPFMLDTWARWDGGWYISIVTQGYTYLGQQETSSVAFFPLYPLLIKLVLPFTGHSAVFAGMLISHLCLLLACLLLYNLVCYETGDEAVANRTVLYLLTAPASFFFSAVYTESLFLLCSVIVFWAARQQRWGWAILAAMLATAARAVGILLWGVVLWELGRTWLSLYRASRSDEAFTLVLGSAFLDRFQARFYILIAVCTFLVPLVLLSFMIFNVVAFGDANAFSKAQAAWGRTGTFTLNIFYEMRLLFQTDWSHLPINVPSIMNLVAIVSGGVLIVPVWRKWGTSYGIYCLFSWLIPILSSTVSSQSLLRYMTVVFPFFMLLGVCGKSWWVDRLIMIVFPSALGFLTAMFVSGRFAG